MDYRYSSPFVFDDIRSPDPSEIGSSVGTPRSKSPSLMGSPQELKPISLPNFLTPGPISVTPSLLDSPLTRKERLPSLPPSRSPSPIPSKFPQHSRYYFQDKMVVFLIEGCLFRVHRYHLDRESSVFPQGVGSDSDPIELPGVTQTEFESLLDFFL